MVSSVHLRRGFIPAPKTLCVGHMSECVCVCGNSHKMLSMGKSGLTERKLVFRGKWVALKTAAVFRLLSWIETHILCIPSLPLAVLFEWRAQEDAGLWLLL